MFYRTCSLVALLAVGCGQLDPNDNGSDLGQRDTYQGEKPWGPSDAPNLLDADMNYTFAELPLEAEADKVPWAGSYWPTYKDNINQKWDGANSQAPSTKYADAFGREGLEDRVSKEFGIDSRQGATTCTTDDECDDDLGEACAIRDGADEGKCVPTWFGICHAWAPVAIMEDEPVSPVEYNGVEFKVQDIKALLTLAYDEGLDVKFMSLRCNENFNDEGEIGEDGNPVDPECADTNAGAFHVAVTNLLGLQGRSFVEDRTIDYEVWNQPVRAYEVFLNEEVTAAEAQEYAGGEGETYTFNPKAETFHRVKLRLDYIGESPDTLDGNLADSIDTYTHSDYYEYIVEIDGAGKIVGGEWVGSSKKAHPDFLWLPIKKKSTELAQEYGYKPNTGIKWEDIQMLLDMSVGNIGDDDDDDDNGGFDWGSDDCAGGSGEFEQAIAHEDTVEVGTIPAGKAGVRIDLTSAADVDVQLIDAADGHEIIAWPSGDLNGAEEDCTTYEGVEICYSGYNGDGTNLGNEWIEINGVTNRTLVMKAYGYQAGNAQVEYSWDAQSDCTDSGSGSFTQLIAHEDVVDVGTIPTGKENIRIELESDEDVDIQLFAGSTAIVQWPDGLLSGSGEESTTYEGMTITWSGYNGVDGEKGHEFITIEGEVSTKLTMKAFGYAEGDADVNYWWGLPSTDL